MNKKDSVSVKVPREFDNYLVKLQKQIYETTGKLFNKTQVMKVISNSKTNVKKKGERKIEFGF